MIRVGVTAASMAMRVGLREVLKELSGIEVAGIAARPDELEIDGLDVLVQVLPADPVKTSCARAVLYLTDNSSDLQEMLNQKPLIWGALPVDANETEFQIAIEALAEGLWIGAPALVNKFLERRLSASNDENDPMAQALTEREIEVLQLTAQGLANKQIALELGISEHTIKFHLSSLYAKLGVSSRTEAVRAGARRGLVVL